MESEKRLDRRTAAQSSLTSSQRSQRARIAANTRWSRQDGSQGTQAARETFLARFDELVDPDGVLDPETRERHAAAARRAYFQRMAYQRHRPVS